jgi:O-antigen/teichoic acid export membrane protein
LTRQEKNSCLKYAVNTLIASGFSTIMPYNENTVINHMVSLDAMGDYTSAQVVPMSVQFIAMSIVVFVFPYFAKNYKDGVWIYKKTKRTVLLMSAAMFGIAAVGIALAPYIILVFGDEFRTPDSIRLMRIFFVTFAINGAVRIPIGNILAAIGEVKFNVYNAIFSCTVHIAICWAMTSLYGINGAAYGLLIGYLISSAASLIYLRYYCKKLERQKKDNPELPIN